MITRELPTISVTFGNMVVLNTKSIIPVDHIGSMSTAPTYTVVRTKGHRSIANRLGTDLTHNTYTVLVVRTTTELETGPHP